MKNRFSFYSIKKSIRIPFSLLGLLLVLLLLGTTSFAQLGIPEEVLDFSVYPPSDAFHPETNSTLVVEIRINERFHINSNQPLESFLIPTEMDRIF